MNYQQIAKELAKREGKKSQVRIGDIREIIKCLIQYDIDCMMEKKQSPICFIRNKSLIKFKKRRKNVKASMRIL